MLDQFEPRPINCHQNCDKVTRFINFISTWSIYHISRIYIPHVFQLLINTVALQSNVPSVSVMRLAEATKTQPIWATRGQLSKKHHANRTAPCHDLWWVIWSPPSRQTSWKVGWHRRTSLKHFEASKPERKKRFFPSHHRCSTAGCETIMSN